MSGLEDLFRGACGILLEEGGDKFDPLALGPGGWSLFFWTAVTFLALLWLLQRFAWRPLMDTVQNREQRIAGDLESAEKARSEAEQIRARHQAELERAAQDAKALLEQARERAQKLEADLEATARETAQGLIERARTSIEAEKQQALREIKDQVVDLSVAVAARLFEKSLDREDHLREADVLLEKLRGSL